MEKNRNIVIWYTKSMTLFVKGCDLLKSLILASLGYSDRGCDRSDQH